MAEQTATCETTLDMLTWNIGGKKPSGTGMANFPKIRTAIAPIIKQLLENTVDVVLFQELSSSANLSRVRDRWGFTDLTPLVTKKKKKETKIKTSFEAGISPSPESNRLKASDNLVEDILKGSVKQEFIDRTHGRLITIKNTKDGKEYSSKIIIISYHAQFIGLKDEEKTQNILNFFQEMCKVAEKQKKTIIIGGDFNHHILDWKDDVVKKYEGRVIVELYVASPRRWDADIIDTFAIVHPENVEDRTLCTFEKTTTIYCFPLVGYIGGEQTNLQDYPPSGNTWFKYLHYAEKDKDKIAEELEAKVEQDMKTLKRLAAKKDQKVQSESDRQKESSEYKERTAVDVMDDLSNSMEKKLVITQQSYAALDGTKQPPPPAPLWPRSPLHSVFDHDPVLTTLTCTLKLNESHASAATCSATPKTHKTKTATRIR